MSEKTEIQEGRQERAGTQPVPTARAGHSYAAHSSAGSALFLQRTIGNQAVQRLFKAGLMQAKLRIGQANDIYEQEADKVAEQVLAAPANPAVSCAAPAIQRLTRQSAGQADTAPASVERALAGSGSPLDPALQRDMGRRFGHDFSQVRVHSGQAAEQSTRDVNAHAYTVGNSIVFGAGRFAPGSYEGQKLIAHELTHVVQQSGPDGMSPGKHRQNDVPGPYPNGVIQRGFFEWIDDLFGGTEFSHEELLSYLNALSKNKGPLGGLDGDNKARVLVKQWKADKTAFNLGRDVKVYLIQEMQAGFTGDDDEQAILDLLKDSDDEELCHIFAPGNVSVKELTDDFDGEELDSLKQWYQSRFNGGLDALLQGHCEPVPGLHEQPKGPELTFNQALEEGAQILHKAGFGKVCGLVLGPDEGDGYDAREWKEMGPEKLVATVEPWLAFKHLVDNLGKDVPSASGGTAKWRFDCDGFTVTNLIYADWRTQTSDQFNKAHSPLELGILSSVRRRWEESGPTMTKPGERPFTEGPPVYRGEGGIAEAGIQTFLDKPMKKLLEEAPVGSKVTWTNIDALRQCEKSNWDEQGTLGFCNWVHENTLKLGPDRYSAHDLGIVNEMEIKKGMAKAVLKDKPVTEAQLKAYMEKNVFISSIRHPKPRQGESA